MESAGLGLVVVAILAPGAPIVVKMLVAMVFALAGTALFLACIRRVAVSDSFVVPLIGIMLGSVVGAVAQFLALSRDLLQMLNSWMLADFSAVLAGRYELLWLVAVLGVLAYIAADRFTVAGLGEDVATGLGLDHRTVVALGMSIVAAVAAVVVVTVGALPLLGLVVPNVVSRVVGDDARRGLPLVALLGAITVLVCDMIGRVLGVDRRRLRRGGRDPRGDPGGDHRWGGLPGDDAAGGAQWLRPSRSPADRWGARATGHGRNPTTGAGGWSPWCARRSPSRRSPR